MHLRRLFQGPIQRTRADVLRILQAERDGTGTDSEWDEFQCVPIADPELEAIRRAVPLEGSLTPKGRVAVERAITTLTVDHRGPAV